MVYLAFLAPEYQWCEDLRSKYFIILFSLVLVAVSITGVDAATDQGLEWGVVTPLTYNMDMLIQVNASAVYDWLDPVNESIYLNITNAPSIPEVIDEWADVPGPIVYGHWANGSSLGLSWIFNQAIDVIVPVGNFSLLTALAEDLTEVGPNAAEPEVFIDNFFQWGCRYSIDLAPERWDVDITFYKRTGLMVNYSVEAWDDSTGEYLGNISVVCDREAPEVYTLIQTDVPDPFRYWMGVDENPGAYEIHLVRGSEYILLERGFWNSTWDMIAPPLEGLGWGTHTFRATFYDASGLSASNVAQRILGPPPLAVFLIASLGGGGIIALVLVIYVKTRR